MLNYASLFFKKIQNFWLTKSNNLITKSFFRANLKINEMLANVHSVEN